jgi:hypothetical protein
VRSKQHGEKNSDLLLELRNRAAVPTAEAQIGIHHLDGPCTEPDRFNLVLGLMHLDLLFEQMI